MTHHLKTWPQFFKAIKSGEKTFEMRKDDRDFKVGDNLRLLEFEPCEECLGTGKRLYSDECCAEPHGRYTGETALISVTYIMKCELDGEQWAIMSIRPGHSKCEGCGLAVEHKMCIAYGSSVYMNRHHPMWGTSEAAIQEYKILSNDITAAADSIIGTINRFKFDVAGLD